MAENVCVKQPQYYIIDYKIRKISNRQTDKHLYRYENHKTKMETEKMYLFLSEAGIFYSVTCSKSPRLNHQLTLASLTQSP
jgi:hypothetical protein